MSVPAWISALQKKIIDHCDFPMYTAFRFRSVTSSIYRNAYGYMMVFDLTNEKTFMNIRDWLTTLRENVASITDDPDVILVSTNAPDS